MRFTTFWHRHRVMTLLATRCRRGWGKIAPSQTEIIAYWNIFVFWNVSYKTTQFWAKDLPFWGHLGAKLKTWAPATFSIRNWCLFMIKLQLVTSYFCSSRPRQRTWHCDWDWWFEASMVNKSYIDDHTVVYLLVDFLYIECWVAQ